MLHGKGKLAVATAAVAVLATLIPSCASILGIEDVNINADGGPSGSGGVAGMGAGASGAAGASGSPGGTGGAGRGGAGGQNPNDGGTSDATGGGPVEGGSPITVHGTVIDYWRHRVPDVALYLGSSTTTTDATGQFTFMNVTPPYDIGLAVRVGLIEFGGSEDAWLFRGLTRSDPTLQVKFGLVSSSSGGITWTFQNFPTGGAPVPRAIGIAFGSPDTIWNETFSDPNGTDLGPTYIDFEGVTSTAGTARALLWETPTAAQVSPTRYVAYDQQPLTIDGNTAKSVTFNMAPDATAADQVAGTVAPAVAGAIQINGYVRFDDGASIHIVQLSDAGQSFQMLMPKLPGSSVSVAALVGSTPDGPFSVAHLDGLTPGQAGVQIDVPAPVMQVAPAAGASNVAATSMFQWTASPHVARMNVYCKGPLNSDGYTTFNVVTEDFKTQLPALGGASGIAWPKGKTCSWAVEIHGSFATVDAAAGPTGYLDPFSYYYYGEQWGPKRDNGGFSVSGAWNFTTAP
jgi:hypothetical protein